MIILQGFVQEAKPLYTFHGLSKFSVIIRLNDSNNKCCDFAMAITTTFAFIQYLNQLSVSELAERLQRYYVLRLQRLFIIHKCKKEAACFAHQ